MQSVFWYFWVYSFFGWVLEKLFAVITHSSQSVRRCFVVLPLCPVYGLGMLAVLALPQEILRSPALPLFGAAAATMVEYAVHWGYERLCGVKFWDYSAVTGNLHGRVSLPFSLCWGILTAAAVWWVQPQVEHFAALISPSITYVCLFPFTADAVVSFHILRTTGEIDLLRYTAW